MDACRRVRGATARRKMRRCGRMKDRSWIRDGMMSTPPTVSRTRCFDALQGHPALAQRREQSKARLDEVRHAVKKCGIIRDQPLAIFCAGSLARMEAGAKSDLDLFVIADKHPDQSSLWQSKIELGEKFFHEVITNPVPLDLNILKSLKRSPLGLDLYLWLVYRTFNLTRPLRITWPKLYRQFGADPAKAGNRRTVDAFRTDCLRELKKIKDAWPDLHYQTAAHCAAPVPDDQPSRNPVCDEGHAHEAYRRDHLHAGGVPGHARRPRPRPLPAQRALLRAARATCKVPDARCRVRAAGAGTAREAATTVVGSVPSEKLRGRSTPGPQRPANALDSSGAAGASRCERASRTQSWRSVAHRLTRSQTNLLHAREKTATGLCNPSASRDLTTPPPLTRGSSGSPPMPHGR